jgi:hypothetical protein
MSIGDVVGEIFLQVVIDLLVKGPGFLIVRIFKADADPDGAWSIAAGLAFWAVLGGSAYLVYRAVAL